MMRLIRTLILFLAVFVGNISFVNAQESVIQGLLMEKNGGSRIVNATVLNKKTGAKVLSNELGLFRITASVGDTLSFSKSGYAEALKPILAITDLVLQMQKIIELAEVKVVGQTKQEELQEIRDQYRKKGSFYGGKPKIGLLSPFGGSPLTFFYELLGKTPGQARRFNLYYMKEMEQTEIDRRFNASLVTRITGLTGADLKNFMVVYRPDYENLSKLDEYGMINYLKKSLITFNNSGRPKGLLSLPALPKAPDLSEKNLKY